MGGEMRYGTVCSGIGSPELAAPKHWQCSFMSEIEKEPRKLLKHHFPAHPLHGDFTTIQRGDYEPIDVLIGGTPCQDFSIAGKRLGLDAPRGNLALEYLALAVRLRPKWLVWENVPGILSSFSDDEIIGTERYGEFYDGEPAYTSEVRQRNDFATFLTYLGECGYQCAWRILDGQHFGVPQRRRRIILVGYIGDWRPAAAVLFERQSLQRDITPRREKRQSVAALTANGVGTCGADDNQGQAGHLIEWPAEVAPTLDTTFGTKLGQNNQHIRGGGQDYSFLPSISMCLNAGGMGRQDSETETLIPTGGYFDEAYAVNLRGREGGAMPETDDLASVRAATGGSSRNYVAYRTAGDGAVYEEGEQIAPLTTGTDPNASIVTTPPWPSKYAEVAKAGARVIWGRRSRHLRSARATIRTLLWAWRHVALRQRNAKD